MNTAIEKKVRNSRQSLSAVAKQKIEQACQKVLSFAEASDYEGYSKFDAFNSPILKALSLNNRYVRLFWSQLVMRFPLNLRTPLLVRKSKNPKGMALFALAYLNLYRFYQEESYLSKAQYCLDWLQNNHSHGYSGYCWGYNFDWQDMGFYAPKYMPNCVVTCFVGRSFVQAYETIGERHYLDIARSAVDFILRDLKVLYESDDMLCVSYAPVDMTMAVMDVSALASALMAKIYEHTGEEMLKHEARRLMNYVVDKKTDYGAWYYTHPPKDSHITHDNYHTGYIVDAILDYSDATADKTFMDSYFRGLEYYNKNLFLNNGAPKFMSDQVYPFDIHGAAQGIITFCKAARFDEKYVRRACNIANWAMTNMQDQKEGCFYYQKRRLYTKKFTLMRWCNSWMARALSELILLDAGF